jgi:hypothetical protein
MTDLAHRYGSPPRARKALLVGVVAAIAVAGLVWLVWVILVHGRPQVTSELVSYQPPTEHSVSARVSVVRRASTVQASCVLQALAADHTVVGEHTFTVGPVAPRAATLERSVRTERKATTVDLVGCTAQGQNQPR